MSITPTSDSSAPLGLSIPRQRSTSPSLNLDDDLGRLSGIAGPEVAINGLDVLDRDFTVVASFAQPMLEEGSVVVGSPIPDLTIDGVRLDGLSAERIKRSAEIHAAEWFGIGADFFASTITEAGGVPVVEIRDRVDRVLIASAALHLAPVGEA